MSAVPEHGNPAYFAGYNLEHNPHPRGTLSYDNWERTWKQANRHHLETRARTLRENEGRGPQPKAFGDKKNIAMPTDLKKG